jgi:hypothetical protein
MALALLGFAFSAAHSLDQKKQIPHRINHNP